MDNKDKASEKDFKTYSFEETLARELDQVWKRRKALGHPRGGEAPDASADKKEIIKQAHKARLLGLAFSGGGIRSATFNLGILQALADLKVLKHVDYLSTVSGGGYIGSWFSAWVRRKDVECHEKPEKCAEESNKLPPDGDKKKSTGNGFSQVVKELKPGVSSDPPDRDPGALQPDPDPIRHLREYSNYLTPKRGLWSTDAWTLGITYLRNLLLTLSVLLGAVFALVLLTGGVASVLFELASLEYKIVDYVAAGLFCISLFVASFILGIELVATPKGAAGGEQDKKAQTTPLNLAVFVTLLAAVIGLLWLWRNYGPNDDPPGVGWLTLAIVLSSLFGGLSGRLVVARRGLTRPDDRFIPVLIAGFASLAVLTVFLYLLGLWMPELPQNVSKVTTWQHWQVVVLGMPLVTLVFSLSTAVFVGFAGRALKELDRELLARYFGVIVKWTVLITALLLFVVYAYPVIQALNAEFATKLAAEMAKAAEEGDAPKSYLTSGSLWSSLTAVWGVLSAVGAWFASAGKADGGSLNGWLRRLVIAISPYVFIAGLFIFAVWATHTLMDLMIENWQWLDELDPTSPLNPDLVAIYWSRMQDGYWILLFMVSLLVALVTLLWSSRIGVNTFSLHALYGNRLVRAYLGASNLKRRAHPFHGFDVNDNDVHMQDLKSNCYSGPLPIINTAINLVSSRRLAWQQRKAASFTFTPLYAGYEFYGEDDPDDSSGSLPRTGGYVSSAVYGGDKGVSLGRALTISGAAASPNMGYQSSPGLTFLMTTFNVRLGWWLPNPGRRPQDKDSRQWILDRHARQEQKRIQSDGPGLGLLHLLKELLGKTDARSDYVYLSDGGHFENLGIYELVRRRCRFVIACDAEADPDMEFGGLGNAVEKCRTDLGVSISIDVSQIRREASTGLSRWHCSVGCIRYSEADPDQPDGTILYIKASRTGGEPQDVQTYATHHASFPHETTADQWFDESQFESYRALGEHSAWKAFETAARVARQSGAEDKGRMKERMFLELRKQWYPHFQGEPSERADHDAMLHGLLDTMREDQQLAFLDGQFYPNLYRIADAHPEEGVFPQAKPTKPSSYKELRAGFFFCKRLIQFMQQVFHDQRLDTEYQAPSNRGWMNLFRRWSWSRMFRFTYTVTAGTYSARFQSFCENQLGLESGEPHFSPEPIHIRVCIDGHSEKPVINYLQKPDDKHLDWDEANKSSDLDSFEHRLLEEFIEAYVRRLEPPRVIDLEVYALKVDSEDPYSEEEDAIKTLSAGFVIVRPKPKNSEESSKLIYFRIRSSMRNMDLARKAFLSLKDHPHLNNIKSAIEEKLPGTDETKKAPFRRRAYHEIQMIERQDVYRCRWFSQLLDDLEEEGAEPGPEEQDNCSKQE